MACYIGLVFGMVFFYVAHFVLGDDLGFVKLHWLNLVGLNLVLMLTIMTIVRYIKPMDKPYVQVNAEVVDITTWKHGKLAGWLLVLAFVLLYTVFSPLGLTSQTGSMFKVIAATAVGLGIMYVIYKLYKKMTSPVKIEPQFNTQEN